MVLAYSRQARSFVVLLRQVPLLRSAIQTGLVSAWCYSRQTTRSANQTDLASVWCYSIQARSFVVLLRQVSLMRSATQAGLANALCYSKQARSFVVLLKNIPHMHDTTQTGCEQVLLKTCITHARCYSGRFRAVRLLCGATQAHFILLVRYMDIRPTRCCSDTFINYFVLL